MSWAKTEIIPTTNYNSQSTDSSVSYSSNSTDSDNSYNVALLNNSTTYSVIRYLFYGSKQDLGLLNWDDLALQNWDEI